MALYDEIFESSLELPNPADFLGEIVLCRERGVDQITPWVATGGDSNPIWKPLADSYTGPAAGCPAATDIRVGAHAYITDIGGTLLPGATSFSYTGGRIRNLPTGRWGPALGDLVLFDIYGSSAQPAAVSGATTIATGTASAMAFGAANPIIPKILLNIGASFKFDMVGKRTAGTTNSLGLQIVSALSNGSNIITPFGVPFNATGATAETGGEGIFTIVSATKAVSQGFDMTSAQNTNGFTDIDITNLAGLDLTLSCLRANSTGGSISDNLSLFMLRVLMVR